MLRIIIKYNIIITLKSKKGENIMDKQEILNRINAIKNIIQASVEGEKIKNAVQADIDKAGISIPDEPEPIGGVVEGNGFVHGTEVYDDDELMEYDYTIIEHEDFLDEREDWKQMEEFSRQIQSKIYQERYTLEDISNYIQTNEGRAFNIESVDLCDCKKTENDSKYENSLDDDDVIAYFDGKYDFSYEGPWTDDVVKAILEKEISLDDLPEKLLFNTSFVDEYIKQVSLIRAREMEQKGITPQEIEDASTGVKLGDFRNSTGQIKEISTRGQEITTEDKNIDD